MLHDKVCSYTIQQISLLKRTGTTSMGIFRRVEGLRSSTPMENFLACPLEERFIPSKRAYPLGGKAQTSLTKGLHLSTHYMCALCIISPPPPLIVSHRLCLSVPRRDLTLDSSGAFLALHSARLEDTSFPPPSPRRGVFVYQEDVSGSSSLPDSFSFPIRHTSCHGR